MIIKHKEDNIVLTSSNNNQETNDRIAEHSNRYRREAEIIKCNIRNEHIDIDKLIDSMATIYPHPYHHYDSNNRKLLSSFFSVSFSKYIKALKSLTSHPKSLESI